MKTLLLVLSAIGAGLISTAAPAATVTATTPQCPSYNVQRDVLYGSDPSQAMDIYYQSNLHGAPVILMVHGGGWARGDKAMPSVVTNKVNHWVPRGYVFISINYRMLPAANPVEQANDVARALAYAQHHAADWGGDPTRLILMGHSAGAHLVALVASDPTIAAQSGAAPWKGTICLDSAAYNVVEIMQLPHLPLYDKAFGTDPVFWKNASPYYRLIGTPQPILAVCSTRRAESPIQAVQFVRKVNSLGARAQVLPENLSHREINEDLGLPSAYTALVDRFMNSLL